MQFLGVEGLLALYFAVQFFLLANDFSVELLAILSDGKFLVIIKGNRNFLATERFVVGVVELRDKRVF